MKIDAITPEKTVLQELGSRLGRLRKGKGLSQDRLAEEAGLGVATLRRIEDGRDAQLGSWIKLLRALGMSQSIEALLPEKLSSPMAEVKAAQKRRRLKGVLSSSGWGDEEQ